MGHQGVESEQPKGLSHHWVDHTLPFSLPPQLVVFWESVPNQCLEVPSRKDSSDLLSTAGIGTSGLT